jgi:hypothetical protein
MALAALYQGHAVSINTYPSLSAAISAWLARDGDADIAARFDDLLALMEQGLYWGRTELPQLGLPACERLRIREMEVTDAAFALGAIVAQPAGFLELIEATLNSPLRPLDIVAEGVIAAYGEQLLGGTRLIAVSGTNFLLKDDPGSATATLKYFKKFDSPSATNPTNWLLTNAPGIYLNGCLREAAVFTGDLDAAKAYDALYAGAVSAMNARRNSELAAATNVRMRLRGRTP